MDKKLGAIKKEVRRASFGSVEEMWKRKREDTLEGLEGGKEGIFRESKTPRSPGGKEGEAERTKVGYEGGWREGLKELFNELREEIRGDLRKIEEEVKGEIREQGKKMREEVEELRKELKEQEETGRKERQEMKSRIDKLEKDVKELKIENVGEKGEDMRVEGVKRDGLEDKVIELERRMEIKDREERRRNVVMREVEVKEGKRVEAVREVLERIGAKGEMVECRRIGGDKGKGRERILVKLSNEEQKREVMLMKKNLRGREERIMDDWTWKERRMRWKLEEIAREEEKNGKRVWIGYGKIKIDEKWWKWDEKEEVLTDERGRFRLGIQGEGEDKDKEVRLKI
ncbi:hypothetical protein DMN91_008044 [Ooceraea biroi]|uniref:Uncharacterized protein n=1 Tax=Ooceraea biroi TaxID=2015173 RepID=A0A3L8DGB7_OOCBI|nr:uncharacterized protein PF11_0207-like [Ooceraea biroi]RLU19487.1 hypothetical protein DMN91_008044 [Ooceraea biroi]